MDTQIATIVKKIEDFYYKDERAFIYGFFKGIENMNNENYSIDDDSYDYMIEQLGYDANDIVRNDSYYKAQSLMLNYEINVGQANEYMDGHRERATFNFNISDGCMMKARIWGRLLNGKCNVLKIYVDGGYGAGVIEINDKEVMKAYKDLMVVLFPYLEEN